MVNTINMSIVTISKYFRVSFLLVLSRDIALSRDSNFMDIYLGTYYILAAKYIHQAGSKAKTIQHFACRTNNVADLNSFEFCLCTTFYIILEACTGSTWHNRALQYFTAYVLYFFEDMLPDRETQRKYA